MNDVNEPGQESILPALRIVGKINFEKGGIASVAAGEFEGIL